MSHPPVELLDRMLISKERGLPLHLQVQGALRQVIAEHCEDGQTFWTESLLIERLGVSRATVRQALAELSREGLLVRQAATGTLVRKSEVTTQLGVFVHRYDSDFQIELLHHLAAECLRRRLHLQIYHTHHGERTTEAFERIKLPPHLEKIVLLGDWHGATVQLHEALAERGYRAVMLDVLLPGFQGCYVGTNNELAVQIGVEHLLQLGHQRIVLLANEPAPVESVRRKMVAFGKLCQAHGLAESRLVDCGTRPGESSFDAAYHTMERVWALRPRPTAIFTVSDPGAWAVLKWCAERQIEVPRQVSVLGFENVRPSSFTHPALTTVAHPIVALARRAVEMLWEDKNQQQFLPPHLVVRQSTGRCLER